MQPTYAMDDAQWNKLIQDVAYYFDDLTLKRGFQYYKQKRVQPFRMTEPRKIKALVEGSDDYSVSINLDDFTLSRCNCPVSGPCKHMAAVLMNYAEQQERSVNKLANATAAAALHIPSASPSSSPATAYNNRQEQLKEQARQLPAQGIAEWRDYFATCLAPLALNTRNPQYVERSLSSIAKLKPKLTPISEKLFSLHTHLFILEAIIQASGSPAGVYSPSLGYFTHLAVSELQDAIAQLLVEELPLAAEPDQWQRISDTIAYLRREMLTEARDRLREQPRFSVCYDLLWRNWITPNISSTELYTEEIAQLQQAEGELGAALSRNALLLAKSRMYFYLSEDQTAMTLLRSAAERPGLHPDEFMSFLTSLLVRGDWPRMAAWLAEIGPLLNSRIYNLQRYSDYWEEAVQHLPEAEPQMWSTLTLMLPTSREIYDEKLLAYGKWQEWMDYQLSIGKEPSDFRVKDLQPLEKNAPEILLPFYHQAAERYVLEKNRHSYKSAVKLLKRLAKLYKKMKREERWELFMNSFTIRHSRLRALQEELRKGKLIP